MSGIDRYDSVLELSKPAGTDDKTLPPDFLPGGTDDFPDFKNIKTPQAKPYRSQTLRGVPQYVKPPAIPKPKPPHPDDVPLKDLLTMEADKFFDIIDQVK